MRVSIVTPVYNDKRVGRALDSVLAQELGSELEVVVIDAGSDRETLDEIDRRRDRIDVLVSEADSGIFDGMNKGIERATGDIVGILNADDRYSDRGVLSDVVQALSRDEAEVCYGNIVYEDSDGRQVRYWRSGPSRRLKWRLGWMPPHPGFFVRKEVYERHGTFDIRLGIAADYELMLRLLYQHGLRAVHLDRVLVRMALGGNSNRSVANIVRAAIEVRESWRMNGLGGGEVAALLKPVGKIDQFFRSAPDSARWRASAKRKTL